MTFGPDMVLGANWFPAAGDAASSGVTQNSDGSITLGGASNWHYNDQLDTGSVGFGGGAYIQATMAIQGPPNWSYDAGAGFPAFWGNGDLSGLSTSVETDFLEFMTPGDTNFSTGMHEWGPSGEITNSVAQGFTAPADTGGADLSQPHTYGWLWVPATGGSQGYAQMYFDGKPVGSKHTWSQGGPLSSVDNEAIKVMFGTSAANPMTISNVQVWQKDSSADLGIVGTSVGNSGGACPTVISPGSSPSGAISSGSPTSTPSGSQLSSSGGPGGASTASNSSSPITPQTSLGQTLAMGSQTGEWGSFADNNGNQYQVTVVDPPGPGGAYEVLIANNGAPYIFALPDSLSGGVTPVSSNPFAGAGTVSSQWGNPTTTDMSAPGNTMGSFGSGTSYPSAANSAPATSNNTSSGQSGRSGRRGSGTATTGPGGSGGSTASTSDPAAMTATNGSSPGVANPSSTTTSGGRGRRSQQISSSTTTDPNAAAPTTSAANNPSSGGSGSSGSSNPSAGSGTAPSATSGSGSGGLSGDLTALQDQMNATAQGSNEYGGVPITLQPGDITYNSGGSLTDAQGNVWTLEPMTGQFAGVPMATVAKNGQQMDPMGGGGFVAALRIVNGEAVWENAKGKGWYNESTYVGTSPTG